MWSIIHITNKFTFSGNFTRLRELERNFRDVLCRFYNDPNPASNDWPSWCYNFTKENNPIRQDVSGITDSGNLFAMESSGHEINRAIQGLDLRDWSVHYRNLQRRAIPQQDHRQLLHPVYQNGSSRSPGSTSEEPDFPQPSGPLRHPSPEELRDPLRHCYTCFRNIQVQKKKFRPFLLGFYRI